MLTMLASTGMALAPGMVGGSQPFTRMRARPTRDFLDSIGVVTTFPDRGQPIERTIEMVRYCGFRWVRAGIEGLSATGPNTIDTMLRLHQQTGALLNWGLVSGNGDLQELLETGLVLARDGALLAFEGSNEPNNWPVTYLGEKGGGIGSWLPVARLHSDLYNSVKGHAELRNYPVWSLSDPGAQTDNAGLQFLEIRDGANALMPDGTRYADFANVHNYLYHQNTPDLADNKVWDAADPSSSSLVNGLYVNFGRTWLKGFEGHSNEELAQLPRVTTETGVTISDKVPERLHGLHLLNLYLAQFARGYSHTSVYILRDRTDESGNQSFGFFAPNYKPRLAAKYLHNLTTILAETAAPPKATDFQTEVELFLEGRTPSIHDFLLQRDDGVFQFVVWGEMLQGSTETLLHFARPPESLQVFNPIIGKEAVHTASLPSSVSLELSDHPLVVQFSV